MEAHFAEYIARFWQYFEALVPGGAIAAHEIAVRAIPQYRQWIEARMSFKWRAALFIVLAAGGLVLAGYWVWHDERTDHAATWKKLQTELRGYRATVYFEPKRIWHVGGASKIEAYGSVINVGPGVAKIIHWKFGLKVLDAKNGDKVNVLSQFGGLKEAPGTPELAANRSPQTIKVIAPKLSKDEAKYLYQQKKRLYFFGAIRYRDGNNEAYEIFPCFMFSGQHTDLGNNRGRLYEAWQKEPCPGPAFNRTRKLNVSREILEFRRSPKGGKTGSLR